MKRQGCSMKPSPVEYIGGMSWGRKICGGLLSGVVWCLTPAGALGDTIVLKNGRRIAALSVTQAGDKITYETSSGTLTLPRSLVDHVERGGVPSVGGSPNDATLSLKPPETEAAAAKLSSDKSGIEQRVIKDGEVDRDYVAQLEGQARSGDPAANENAAAAHHAASQFELARGDMDLALADERTALTYLPEQPALLMNVAYLYLRRSEYTQSLEYLDRARRVAPEDPEVSKLAGWAYYGLNKLDQAVAEWKHALALRPDREVEAALEKAQRDKQEEEKYKENESSHFTLRYSGASEPALARDVLRTLERHFDNIASELSYAPPDPIGVILYTQQAFADITQAPNWVGALNDGRIRVPVQGLSDVTPDLSRVLKHELTHSFVQQKARSRAPTWIQEGLAQWMEGKRSDMNATALVSMYRSDPVLGLAHYEGSWMKLSSDAAGAAYAWALANVEYIVKSGGMADMDRILERLAGGDTPEGALNAVLHVGYRDLTQDTAEFLRKTYGN
jgi:tetratricopeptide (TPR) repeat protein